MAAIEFKRTKENIEDAFKEVSELEKTVKRIEEHIKNHPLPPEEELLLNEKIAKVNDVMTGLTQTVDALEKDLKPK